VRRARLSPSDFGGGARDLSDGVRKQRFGKLLELIITSVLSKGFFLFCVYIFSFFIVHFSLTYG